MKNKIITVLCALFMIFFIAHKCDKAIQKENEQEVTEPKKEIHCMVCGKDLTDDYNRISPNFNGNYYCTPCYEQTMREVHEDMQAEGYD
jgi:hypothetical protein